MKLTLLLLASLALTSCSHLCYCPDNPGRPPRPDRPDRPERPDRPDRPERPPAERPPLAPPPPATAYLSGSSPSWDDMDDVKAALGSKATYSGTKVNLNGNAISGKNLKHPDNAQDEDAVPLVVSIEGFRLENGIVRDIPGGIVVKKDDNVFKALTFMESGEDFLSTSTNGASGLSVWNCQFLNDRREDADKSIQANSAVDASIKDNYFTGGITAIRLQESSSNQTNVHATVENNIFERVSTAVNGAGDLTIHASGNRFYHVRHRWNLGDDVSLEFR